MSLHPAIGFAKGPPSSLTLGGAGAGFAFWRSAVRVGKMACSVCGEATSGPGRWYPGDRWVVSLH